VAYRWLCGRVSVSHQTLSDFRVAHVDWLLDGVLTAAVAAGTPPNGRGPTVDTDGAATGAGACDRAGPGDPARSSAGPPRKNPDPVSAH